MDNHSVRRVPLFSRRHMRVAVLGLLVSATVAAQAAASATVPLAIAPHAKSPQAFVNPPPVVSDVPVRAVFQEWDQSQRTWDTPTSIPIPNPLPLVSPTVHSALDAQWRGFAVTGSRYLQAANPFCSQVEASLYDDPTSNYQHMNQCTPQPLPANYVSAERATTSLSVQNLGPNDLLFHYSIPCGDPRIARNTDYFNEMGYSHCKKQSDPTKSVGHEFFAGNFGSSCGDVNVDIYADMQIDLELTVDPLVDVSGAGTGPFHVKTAVLHFSNAFVNPSACSDQCHHAAIPYSSVCLDQEATLNAKVVDLTSLIDISGINSQFHSLDPAHPSALLQLAVGLYGAYKSTYAFRFNLDAQFVSGALALTFRRDDVPLLDQSQRTSTVASLGYYAFGRVTTFALDWSGSIWEERYFNGWEHWVNHGSPAASPGGDVVAAPTTFARKNGYVGVVVTTRDGRVFEGTNAHNGWVWAARGSPPGTTAVLAPGVAIDRFGVEHIFTTGANGRLFESHQSGAGWLWSDQGLPAAGHTIVGAPVGVALPNGYLATFARDDAGHVRERYYNASGWHWTDHGTPTPTIKAQSDVGVTTDGGANVYAFVTDSNGHLDELSYVAGRGWQWADRGLGVAGAKVTGTPAPIRPPSQTRVRAFDIFTTDANGHLDLFTLTLSDTGSGTIDEGVPLGSTTASTPTSGPSAVVAPDGYEGAFVVAANQDLGEMYLPGNWADHTVAPDGSLPIDHAPSMRFVQTNVDGANTVDLGVSGSGFTANGDIRIDVHNPSTGNTYYGWPTADANGDFFVSVGVPRSELAFCGPACGYTATGVGVSVLQYSLPQMFINAQTVTLTSKPTISAVPTLLDGTGPVTMNIVGSGFDPNSDATVGVFGKASFVAGVTTDANGRFAVDVPISRSELTYCGPACGYSATLSINAQSNRVFAQMKQVAVSAPARFIAIQTRNGLGTGVISPFVATMRGSGFTPGGSVQFTVTNIANGHTFSGAATVDATGSVGVAVNVPLAGEVGFFCDGSSVCFIAASVSARQYTTPDLTPAAVPLALGSNICQPDCTPA